MCVGALNTLTARVVQQVESFAAAAALQLPSLLKTLNAVPFFYLLVFFCCTPTPPLALSCSSFWLLFCILFILRCLRFALAALMLQRAASCALRVFITYTHSQPAGGWGGGGGGGAAGGDAAFCIVPACVEANKNAAATPAALLLPHKQTNKSSKQQQRRQQKQKPKEQQKKCKKGGWKRRRSRSKCNTELCFLVELNNCGYHTAALRQRFNGALQRERETKREWERGRETVLERV